MGRRKQDDQCARCLWDAGNAGSSGWFPGGRAGGISWTDPNGNFWLFGGTGIDANGHLGSFNDLWEFNPSSNEWTWISGGTSVGVQGVYGVMGKAAAGNVPGSREGPVGWTDRSGNLWLFGGYGEDASGSSNDLNDLWTFSPSSKEWTWAGGSSTVPTTGPSGYCGAGTYGSGGYPRECQRSGWTQLGCFVDGSQRQFLAFWRLGLRRQRNRRRPQRSLGIQPAEYDLDLADWKQLGRPSARRHGRAIGSVWNTRHRSCDECPRGTFQCDGLD